jgi:hypothetical protein
MWDRYTRLCRSCALCALVHLSNCGNRQERGACVFFLIVRPQFSFLSSGTTQPRAFQGEQLPQGAAKEACLVLRVLCLAPVDALPRGSFSPPPLPPRCFWTRSAGASAPPAAAERGALRSWIGQRGNHAPWRTTHDPHRNEKMPPPPS